MMKLFEYKASREAVNNTTIKIYKICGTGLVWAIAAMS